MGEGQKPAFDESQPFTKAEFDESQPFQTSEDHIQTAADFPNQKVDMGGNLLPVRQMARGAILGSQEALEPKAERLIANLFGDQQTKDYYDQLSDKQIFQPIADQNAKDAKDYPGATALFKGVGMMPAVMASGGLAAPEMLAGAMGPTAAGILSSSFGSALPVGMTVFNESQAPTLGEKVSEGLKATGEATKWGVGAGAALEAASPYLSKTAEWLNGLSKDYGASANRVAAEQALGGTKGQVQKLQASGRVQKLGQWLRDNNVFNGFRTKQGMLDKVEGLQSEAGEQIGSAMQASDEAAGAAGFMPVEDVTQQMRKDVLEPLANNPHAEAEAGWAQKQIESLENSRKGQYLSFQEMMDFKNYLIKKTRAFERTGDLAAAPARDLYGVYADNIEKGIEKLSPQTGVDPAAFQASKQNYSMASTAQPLLESSAAAAAKNQGMGLGSKVMAAPVIAANLAGGNVLKAGMEAAGIVGANEAYNSLSGQWKSMAYGGMEKLANLSAGQLGQYLPILQKALQGGAQNFAVTYYILSSTDPNFRKLTQDENTSPNQTKQDSNMH